MVLASTKWTCVFLISLLRWCLTARLEGVKAILPKWWGTQVTSCVERFMRSIKVSWAVFHHVHQLFYPQYSEHQILGLPSSETLVPPRGQSLCYLQRIRAKSIFLTEADCSHIKQHRADSARQEVSQRNGITFSVFTPCADLGSTKQQSWKFQ